MSRIRQSTAIVCAAALLGGAGLSAAQAASGDGGSRPARCGPPGGAMNSAALAKIASTLGVTTAQLRAALDANRPAKPADGTRGPAGMASAGRLHEDRAARRAERTAREAAMYAAVASDLGLSAAAVKAAFEANRPAKPAR